MIGPTLSIMLLVTQRLMDLFWCIVVTIVTNLGMITWFLHEVASYTIMFLELVWCRISSIENKLFSKAWEFSYCTMLYTLFNLSLAPYTQRLICSSWNSQSFFPRIAGSCGGWSEGFPWWNYGAYSRNGKNWNTLGLSLCWIGSYGEGTNRVIT